MDCCPKAGIKNGKVYSAVQRRFCKGGFMDIGKHFPVILLPQIVLSLIDERSNSRYLLHIMLVTSCHKVHHFFITYIRYAF